ncbi:MAG: T9SS type A sorting domain-containing protein [Bacteroidota bacterium]|nr:T9SS type A sorting domain-containing protein [Bacteroidota bacterium]
MGYFIRIFTLILIFAVSNVCYSQVGADAGNDTAFCSSNYEGATIGGNPSAIGGTEPYTYTWSAKYEYAGRIYTASSFLEDTSVANPVFSSSFDDSAVFHLSVTDANDDIAFDSVMVRFSNYIICLGECRHEISLGDSAQLGHCISGGIPPFKYAWTPEKTLSDPTSESPWAKPQSYTHYELVYTDSIGCQTTFHCHVYIIPSGIETDDSGGDYLQIYPNPASGIVNFTFNHPQHDNSVLKLFSVEGRLVKEALVNDPVLTVDLSDLGQGLYFYNWIISDETVGSGKIVVE